MSDEREFNWSDAECSLRHGVCLVATSWFEGKRPKGWTKQQHLDNPTAGCVTAREQRLAVAVAKLLKGPKTLQQHLLYIEFSPKDDRPVRQAIPVPVKWTEKQIKQVWTLYHFTNKDVPPLLPYKPVHHNNAFLEDCMHDWNIDSQGRFRYASRVTDEPVWILLEVES